MNQSQYEQSMDFFRTGCRICFGLAAAAFVTSVVLFFVFNIPSILMIRREFIRCGMIRKKGRKRLAAGGIWGILYDAGKKWHGRYDQAREKDTSRKTGAVPEDAGFFTPRSCYVSAGDRRRDVQTTKLLGPDDFPAESAFRLNNEQKVMFNHSKRGRGYEK